MAMDSPSGGGEPLDLIAFTNVIEHLEYPEKGIRNLRIWLKDGGVVYVECPNVFYYHKNSSSLSDLYCAEHVNHFSVDYLNYLFEKCGFVCLGNSESTCIAGIYKKTTEVLETPSVSFNTGKVREACLKAYDLICKQKEAVKKYFDKQFEKKIAVWGLSHTFMQMYPEAFESCIVDFIIDIDRSKQGLSIGGINVCSPDVLRSYEGAITVLNISSKQNILEYINQEGFENEIIAF